MQNISPAAPQTNRVLTAAYLFTAAGITSLIFSGVLIAQNPTWQTYVIGVITLFTLIAFIAALFLARRENTNASLQIFFWSVMVIIPLSAMFVKNTAPMLIGLALVTGFAQVYLLHPREWRRRTQVVPVLSALAITIIDLLQPSFRITLIDATEYYAPGLLGFIVLGLIGTLYYQSRENIAKSLRLKITVWTGTLLIILSGILITISLVETRSTTIQTEQDELLAYTETLAGRIRADSEIPLDAARTLAQAFTSIKDPDNEAPLTRDQVNAMLEQLLEENPSFLGTYTLWEPNAFDGQDTSYRNTPAHDETGRFIPYWVRSDNGNINVIALEQYETPGIGDWYIKPRQTQQEVTVAPLIYPIDGVDTVMASFVAPILYAGQFHGIVGVDAPISYTQDILNSIELFEGNLSAALFTTEGTLISVRNQPEMVSQPANTLFSDFAEIQPMLGGESFVNTSPDGETLRIFAPIRIGETQQGWYISLLIPISEITEPATQLATREGLIGTSVVLVALFFLWLFSGQISQPIQDLTQVANALAKGDLQAKANIRSTDETGILAETFNIMTTQLRGTLSSLEERVAERTRNLELAAEVGRTVSQVRALDIMLTDAAEIIRQQFNLYYVQVYLVNPSQTYLNLEAGTGEVGKLLLSRNHRLPFNSNSINGRAAIQQEAVVISDTTRSSLFRPNPLLPETRAEMAVPLMVGRKVVGVLDMQSSVSGTLNQDTLPAFEALAGQLAIAIQNANFLAEVEESRLEVEKQAARLARRNFKEYLDAIHKPEETGYVFEKDTLQPLAGAPQAQNPENALVEPIAVTGAELGKLVVEFETNAPPARSNELINTVARQVAQHVENLRLLESAERFRVEAEEASRRMTRESWQNYLNIKDEQALGYFYNLKEIQRYEPESQPLNEEALNLPLKIREETIGRLSVQGLNKQDTDGLDLALAVAERLSQHIESLRLLEQTEKSRSEIQLSQERLSEALEIARLGNWEYDVEKDLFTFNDNFYLVFHTTVQEIGSYQLSSGEYVQRFVYPEDAPVVGVEIGKALTSTDAHYIATVEHRVVFADGGMGYISVNVHVERDEQGKITRFYGANQNITEQKLAEEALRAREVQLSIALAQTEKLSKAGMRFTQASNLQELTAAAVEVLGITNINRAVLSIFNYSENEELGSMEVVANWWNGSGHSATEVGTKYTLETLKIMPMFLSSTPVFMNNAQTDERMDEDTRRLLESRNIRSMASLPLFLGANQIGNLILEAEELYEFTQDEAILFTAMAPQIATVLDNRRQFIRAQQQAQRESTLNLINQKIQSATTVEAVLQIAARELGHALGAPMTIAQLSLKDKPASA